MISIFEDARRAQILGPRPRQTAPQPVVPQTDEFWERESKAEPVTAPEPVQEEEDPEAIALREQAAALLEQAKAKKEAPKRDLLEYQFDQIAPRLRASPLATLTDLAMAAEGHAASLSEAHAERLREVAHQVSDMQVRDATRFLDELTEKYGSHPNTAALAKALIQVQSAHRRSLSRQNPSYRRRIEEIDLGWQKFHKSPKVVNASSVPLKALFSHAAAAVRENK